MKRSIGSTFAVFLLLLFYYTGCIAQARVESNPNCADFVNLNLLEGQLYSQFGEDGILLGLIDLLNRHSTTPSDGSTAPSFSEYFVEFGVESGIQCNSRALREHLGYTGLMMDGGYANTSIGLHQEFVTEGNILHLLQKYNVPLDLDVLSVDVDMFDYWILARILSQSQYRPRIIIVETNPTLCVSNYMTEYRSMNKLPLSVIHPDHTNQTVWDGTRYSGANSEAFRRLGKRYGYDMLHCERCGVNCFLVRRDAIPAPCHALTASYSPMIPYPCFSTLNPHEPGGTMIGHPFDPLQRAAVMVDEKVVDVLTARHSRVAFRGRDHIDPQRMGYVCSSDGGVAGWGGDICSQWYILGDDSNRDRGDGAGDELYRAYRHLADSEYSAAASLFHSLLDKNYDSSEDEGSERGARGCRSNHLSEQSCLHEYKLLFNTALSHFNTAAATGTAASNDGHGNSQEEVVTVLQAALRLLGRAISMEGDTVGEHSRVQSLLSFITFLLPSILQPREFVRERMERRVELPLSMTSSTGDGGSRNTSITITACDDTVAVSSSFCTQHSISADSESCETVRQGLERARMRELFPSPTAFDWATLVRGEVPPSNGGEVFRGFTILPECYNRFEAVRLLVGSCTKRNKEKELL